MEYNEMRDLIDTIEINDDDIRKLQIENRDKKQDLIEQVVNNQMYHCLTLNMNRLKQDIR